MTCRHLNLLPTSSLPTLSPVSTSDKKKIRRSGGLVVRVPASRPPIPGSNLVFNTVQIMYNYKASVGCKKRLWQNYCRSKNVVCQQNFILGFFGWVLRSCDTFSCLTFYRRYLNHLNQQKFRIPVNVVLRIPSLSPCSQSPETWNF